MTRVAILGAGPAGLGAALGLARRGHQVTVVERADHVGGNAGSFELAGMPVDYGSHRFHAAAEPAVLELVRELLGDELLLRPRHGRIRLLGRWIHFPLRPVDLALRLHPRFTVGVLGDLITKPLSGRKAPSSGDTFASVLQRGLGRTICREFYFPYARKIWGIEPQAISPIQAYKRVSAGSVGKLVRRLFPRRADDARGRRGYFYYPRRGYGQISDRLRQSAESAGARFLMSTSVTGIALRPGQSALVQTQSPDGQATAECDQVWSTIPVTALTRIVAPQAPPEVQAAAGRLELRAMLLVYLVLETDQFTEFDAHYFPEEALPFTRISEPKNYSTTREPRDVTVLCAEMPCGLNDDIWSASEETLGQLVCDGLARAGLPVSCPVREVVVRRLPAAYPIYHRGYEEHFGTLDTWVDSLEGLLSFGRQGLYAHDNTHHALAMASAAVECLGDGQFDRQRWASYRDVFEGHVVED